MKAIEQPQRTNEEHKRMAVMFEDLAAECAIAFPFSRRTGQFLDAAEKHWILSEREAATNECNRNEG